MTKPKAKQMKAKPNKLLQQKLRELIDADSLYGVANSLQIGRETLARYLADVPMQVSTFRGIEVILADHSRGAGADGLR